MYGHDSVPPPCTDARQVFPQGRKPTHLGGAAGRRFDLWTRLLNSI